MKNVHRHFNLISYCFCPIVSLHNKFHPNWIKNKEVESFHFCLILVGRSGRSKNSRSHFKHSIAIWKVINDLCTEELGNKASANKENPPITTKIFSPQMPFLLILYIGNKASLAIRHEINWSLEMRYCGVPLYQV